MQLETTVNSFLIYTPEPPNQKGAARTRRGTVSGGWYRWQFDGRGRPGSDAVVEDLAHEGVELIADQLLPLQQLVTDPLDRKATLLQDLHHLGLALLEEGIDLFPDLFLRQHESNGLLAHGVGRDHAVRNQVLA